LFFQETIVFIAQIKDVVENVQISPPLGRKFTRKRELKTNIHYY